MCDHCFYKIKSKQKKKEAKPWIPVSSTGMTVCGRDDGMWQG